MIKQPGVLDWALQEWTEKGVGPLATGVSGTGFLSYSSVLPPDLQESLAQRVSKLVEQDSTSSIPGLAKQLHLQKELLLNKHEADLQYNFGATGTNPDSGDNVANFFNHGDLGGYAGIVSVLTHAFSRGFVHIQSFDPEIHPIIDPRYMSHPVDLEVLSDGLLFTQKISETKPLADMYKDNAAGDGKKIQPSFKVDGRLTKQTAVRIIKNSAVSSFHPVGTCSMLPREDGGVVDSKLKVYGTENVRVVDASIAPLNVRGNIASLVYAIAERAGDIIKEERKSKA
jgi:choline dehydrogenase